MDTLIDLAAAEAKDADHSSTLTTVMAGPHDFTCLEASLNEQELSVLPTDGADMVVVPHTMPVKAKG
jgi:hypothetical protein